MANLGSLHHLHQRKRKNDSNTSSFRATLEQKCDKEVHTTSSPQSTKLSLSTPSLCHVKQLWSRGSGYIESKNFIKPSFKPFINQSVIRKQQLYRASFLIIICYFIYGLRVLLFGMHPLHGGLLGQFVDHQIRTRKWKETLQIVNHEIHSMGISLDGVASADEHSKAKSKSIPNAALRQIVVNAYRERAEKRLVKRYTKLFWYKCNSLDLSHVATVGEGETHMDLENKVGDDMKLHMMRWKDSIPRFIFRPIHPLWYGPTPSLENNQITADVISAMNSSNFTFSSKSGVLLAMDENDQRDFFMNQDEGGYQWSYIYQVLPTERMKRYLWVIATLYYHGGVFFGEGVRHFPKSMQHLFDEQEITLESDMKDGQRDRSGDSRFCPSSPKGFIRLRRSQDTISPAIVDLHLLMFTPGHPFLASLLKSYGAYVSTLSTTVIDQSHTILTCFVNAIEREVTERQDTVLEQEGLYYLYKVPLVFQQDIFEDSRHIKSSSFQLNSEDITERELGHEKHYLGLTERQITMAITEEIPKESYLKEGNHSSTLTEKVLLDDLIALKCPKTLFLRRWICHRCLRSFYHGSYSRCQWSCGSCIETLMCSDDPNERYSGKEEIAIQLDVRGWNIDEEDAHTAKLIPRVIHQTWNEDIDPMKYPHLLRLQNSWKGSGWKYEFYTDERARSYIEANYPPQFLDAYDSLLPGAFKADLFRYLVLLKDGGIYADVDVLLQANLETFITPSMSFFAPRDAVAEYAQGQYCLWNGMIGAAPGHPYLVKAVERLVNLILDRSNVLDLERDVCHVSGKDGIETWKVRAVQELLLSGPCALGISVNEALGRNPTTSFDIGWLDSVTMSLYQNFDVGDTLILLQDKNDLGAMRFTDAERNIMVASTDMNGLSKKPLRNHKSDHKSNGMKHYSLNSGSWLWGTRGIYNDTKVSTEYIKLKASYTQHGNSS